MDAQNRNRLVAAVIADCDEFGRPDSWLDRVYHIANGHRLLDEWNATDTPERWGIVGEIVCHLEG